MRSGLSEKTRLIRPAGFFFAAAAFDSTEFHGIGDRIHSMTDRFLNYVRCCVPAALWLGLSFCAPGAWAAKASYYDCEFDVDELPVSQRASAPRVLRFMLNTKLKIAFRIDTAMARPVRIFVSNDEEFSLLDNSGTSEILLVSVRRDGRSIYSRHAIGKVAGNNVGAMGIQVEGWCYPSMHHAAVPGGIGNPA
jgi:hypothetical protein